MERETKLTNLTRLTKKDRGLEYNQERKIMDSCLTSKSKDLFHLGHKNFLQDTSLKAKEIKAKMNYWHFIKITSFCTAKQTINQTKRQPMESKKIFAK